MGSFSPEPWLPRPFSPSGLVLAAALLLLVLCLRVRRTRHTHTYASVGTKFDLLLRARL
ncbi:hypothetical protein J1605_001864 [Eschrichtius robustus]|uniref:Uncharacterized protein n=1 Tax=Eschrichtius robustus TaxID=9764 RepID=A0AB34I0F2_ESCRO|nr:hypothetical protein J1605_001864 [Eschrichtius robustus]